jgi:hypothetical protein
VSAGGKGFRVWWDEDAQIARADWIDKVTVDLELAEACEAEVQALGHGRMAYLVDIREMGSIDREARAYFMSMGPLYKAVGLLAGSPATRMMANFFLRLNRGDLPVRMFTDEVQAISWLHDQP